MRTYFSSKKTKQCCKWSIVWIFLILSFSSLELKAQNPGEISLSDCLKKAREYHPFFSDKQKIDNTRSLKMRNISTMWLPQLNLNGQATYQSEAIKIDVPIPGVNISGSPQDQYKVTLDVNQVIYDGGAASAQKKTTNASVDAELQQNETDIYKVNEQVTGVYFNTLLLQVSRNLYTNTLEDLSSKEQKISSGVRNGILIQTDLDILKVEILKSKQMLNEIDMALNNSLQVLGDLTGDSSVLSSKLIMPDVNVLSNDSVNRPELKLFDLQKDMMEGSKYISSSQRTPKLYAFTQLGYGRPGLNMLKNEFEPYYIVGLKFQWNLWDWNKSSREKSIYTIQQDMVDSKKESYLRGINISGLNEITRMNQLENSLKTDEEILALRKDISKQTEKRLDQGIVTMTEYLTEYNAEVKAGLQLETHKIQLIQSKTNYLIIKGLL